MCGGRELPWAAEPAAGQRLDSLLAAFRTMCWPPWAHMSLRMTDWAIRYFTPTHVSHWLDLAEQRAL